MGVFQGLSTAKVTESGNKLQDGKYVLEVLNCSIVNTNKHGDAFCVEFLVKDSDNDAFKSGEKVSWMQFLKDKTVAWPSIMAFMHAVYGFDRKLSDQTKLANFNAQIEVTADKAIAGDGTALQGRTVNCVVETITTVKNQQPFRKHTFTYVERKF